FSSVMVMILTVPLGTAYTDHLTRPQGQERTGGPVGQDPVPGLLIPGEGACHRGWQRDRALEHPRLIRGTQQRQGRDGEVQPEPARRDRDPLEVQTRS